jgi:TRAP-type C4-dicarboxylate transport system permease small subunit
MLQLYIRSVDGLSRALAVLATALIVIAMLVVCHLVLTRYIFRAPTIWQTDFVIFAATAAIFIGAPYVLLKGGHVGVDVVEMMLQPRARNVMRFIGRCLGLLFCAAMLVASWIQFHEAWTLNWRHSSVWGPPLWPALMALPIGFGALCLQYVAEMLKGILGMDTAASGHAPDIREAGEISAANAVKETQR